MNMENNYLLTIFKEHQKKPYPIVMEPMYYRVEIENRIAECIGKELGLDIKEITKYLRAQPDSYGDHSTVKKILLNICKTINNLKESDVNKMSEIRDGIKFYQVSADIDNFLKFIIMYIWEVFYHVFDYGDREKKLNDFKNLITNKPVLIAIESMDKHFRKNKSN